jgi:hypothetical protein
MCLPAVAKYGASVLSPGVTLMLFAPSSRTLAAPAYCERGDPSIQRAPPPDLFIGVSTAKVDEVPGDTVPIPSTKRRFSRRGRAGSVVGELQRRPPSSMPCIMSHERGPA